MKNYKDVQMGWKNSEVDIFTFNDLSITAKIQPEEPEERRVNNFCLTATIGDVIVGKINGLYTSAYAMFTKPVDVLCELDGESAIYADEGLAYLEKVLPQETIEGQLECLDLLDEDIDKKYENAEYKKKVVSDIVDGDDGYTSDYIVFFDDIIVHPDYRQNGIFTKLMEVVAFLFGADYSGAAYIYPVKTEANGDVVDDEDHEEGDLQRNRIISEKHGWILTDDFYPSATDRNTYALKLPEYILDIAKIGHEFRKYVPSE